MRESGSPGPACLALNHCTEKKLFWCRVAPGKSEVDIATPIRKLSAATRPRAPPRVCAANCLVLGQECEEIWGIVVFVARVHMFMDLGPRSFHTPQSMAVPSRSVEVTGCRKANEVRPSEAKPTSDLVLFFFPSRR